MPLPPATLAALREAAVDVREDVPLARMTWWRTGGPADGWVEAEDVATLAAVQRAASATDCPVFVLGNGSNLLVSDRGVRGLVVHLSGALTESVPVDPGEPPRLRVGAGLRLAVLLARAQRNGWTGLECFAGVPGTLGGAVRMNAGTHLGETVDCLESVHVVLREGTELRLDREALQMSYRTCHLPERAIVAWAVLHTTGTDPEASRAAIRAHLEHRKATQPLDLPSCGSTFRNPPGDFAGRLIEHAGLKGLRVGQAQISEKHANFLVNLGGATSGEIRTLLERVQHEVEEQFGVCLEREVHYAGDWSDRE